VTLAARDCLTDPSVLTAIAPPPHAEERYCGRDDEDCTDGPPIDIHSGEPGACPASAHPLIGGPHARTTPTCYRARRLTINRARQQDRGIVVLAAFFAAAPWLGCVVPLPYWTVTLFALRACTFGDLALRAGYGLPGASEVRTGTRRRTARVLRLCRQDWFLAARSHRSSSLRNLCEGRGIRTLDQGIKVPRGGCTEMQVTAFPRERRHCAARGCTLRHRRCYKRCYKLRCDFAFALCQWIAGVTVATSRHAFFNATDSTGLSPLTTEH
jgi:hypothetical protein